MELVTVFRERKKCLCCLQETTRKLKKMFGFTEAFIQWTDNFKKSALSEHDKVRYRCKLLTKVNIFKLQNIKSIIVQVCS